MQGMPPVVWDRAQGFLVRDAYGNQWIDLTSGIVMANAGHAHPRILSAIQARTEAELLFSYAFPTELRVQALERLVSIAPSELTKAILFSSGTEACECAISLMRKHGYRISPRKLSILSIKGSYHGRTLAAKFSSGAPELVDGLDRTSAFHYQLSLPGGSESAGFEEDVRRLEVDADSVAGILIESIPGWSTTPYPHHYVEAMIRWAGSHRVLLSCDEVKSGIARTGRISPFEH